MEKMHTMSDMKNSKGCVIVNTDNDILFADDIFLSVFKPTQNKLPKKTTNQFNQGICLLDDSAVLVTINITPLKSHEITIGYVYKLDLSLEQFKRHSYLQSLTTINYRGEKFSPTDIKLLLLLSQFKNVKTQEVARTLEISQKSAYMYKYNLMSKLRACFSTSMFNLALIELLKLCHSEKSDEA